MITIFQNIRELDTPYHKNITFIFDRIRNGNTKELCEAIRSEPEKKKRNELKKGLPSILFSGIFNNRRKGAVPISHSGYIVIDIDDLDMNLFETKRALICENQYIYSCFVSPSGNGFKVIIKIPKDIKRHRNYFLALESFFANSFDIEIDTSGKNISRVCYESYDPDIFVNEKSLVFTDYIEDITPVHTNTDVPTIRVTDLSEVQKRVVTWWQKNYSYTDGHKHHAIIALAGAFNRYGVSQSDALNFCNSLSTNPASHKANEQRVKYFYKKYASKHNTEHFEDADRKNDIVNRLGADAENAAAILKEYEEFDQYYPHELEEIATKIKEETKVSKKTGGSGRVFWYYDDGKLKIDTKDLFTFIEDMGYYIYYPVKAPDQYKLVHLSDGILRYVDTREIKIRVLEFVESQKQNQVYNILNDRMKYWSEKFLNILPKIDPHILRDSKDVSYIPTPSGLYKITAKEVKKIDYADLSEGVVWESQITDKDFQYTKRNGDFERFAYNLSGGKMEALMTLIGYTLHTYKDPLNPKAGFLFDQNISQIDGEPEGGSGKSLIAEGFKYIREVAPVSGDRVDFKRPFVFQEACESTQVIWVDEMPKDADYHPFFSRMTNNLPIEKKNAGVLSLPFQDSPKFFFTQNFKPKGVSGSHKRRKEEFGVSNYYNSNFSTSNDFDKIFFIGWEQDDWNEFFTFYADCIKLYLKEGIISAGVDAHLEYATELGLDFANFFIEEGNLDRFIAIGKVTVHDVYNQFITNYETDITIKPFVDIFRQAIRMRKIKFEEKGKGAARILIFKK